MTDTRLRSRIRQRMVEIKIGAFIFTVLLLGVAVIFLLGQRKNVFEDQVSLHAKFKDVAGLREGASVRLSGVNVGSVSRVFIADDPKNPHVVIDMDISSSAIKRIRKDSVARIGSQGLLGDKLIEISVGTSAAAPVAPGGHIATQEAPDFNRVIAKAEQVMDNLKRVSEAAAAITEGFDDPASTGNMKSSVASIRDILHAVENGPGLAHWMLYNKESTQQFLQLTERVNLLLAHVDSGVIQIEKILATTDQDGKNVVNNVSRAAKSIGETAGELQKSNIIANMENATRDVALVANFVKSGRGSLGGVIADPTIYHQLLSIVGGVERSRLLRAVVRYAIAQDDNRHANDSPDILTGIDSSDRSKQTTSGTANRLSGTK